VRDAPPVRTAHHPRDAEAKGSDRVGDTRTVKTSRAFAVALIERRRAHEDGQTAAEYAVVLSMITAGIVAMIAALSESVRAALEAIATSI
jgi:Flp pilus assembly pilin Flp